MGSAGAPPPLGCVLGCPVKTRPSLCVLPRHFGSSASKGVRRNKGTLKIGGRLGPAPCGRGIGDPQKYTRMCYPVEFGRSRSNGTCVSEIRLNNVTLLSRFSNSLKVIGTDNVSILHGIYDFLLTFHSNHGPMSYRFRDSRRFQSKIANFPTPV